MVICYSAQGCLGGDVPLEKLGNFVFLKVGSVVNTFFILIWWIILGANLEQAMRKIRQPHFLLLYVYLTRCLFSVCSTHIHVVQAVFFYLPIYSDKENNPEFEKKSYPHPIYPYAWKKNMKKGCGDNFFKLDYWIIIIIIKRKKIPSPTGCACSLRIPPGYADGESLERTWRRN